MNQTKVNKALLRELPYYSCDLISSHGQFNNSLDTCLPTKKYLDRLPSFHDYLFIYLFIYYFPTIKITQALHYTKMWRGDLRKPQGLYEEIYDLNLFTLNSL